MSKRPIYVEDAIEWVENILEIDKYYHPHAKSRNVPIDEVIDRLKRVPTAQPEIIRCKDCAHYDLFNNGANGTCQKNIDAMAVFYPNDFCSYGERRTE